MSHVPGFAIATIALAIGGQAAATTNLVTNGGFESTTNGYGLLGGQTNVTGWVDTFIVKNGKTQKFRGQDYVYQSGTADTKLVRDTSAVTNPAHYDSGELWGAANKGAASFTGVSPAGGNFVSLTGGRSASAFTQTISALKSGRTYVLTFDYAFAQGYGAQKPGSPDSLSVSLGSQTQSTPTFLIPSRGFSGWQTAIFTFRNFAGSDLLSFFAHGSAGDPPYALLDGVSLTSAVPEPSAWVMMLLGLGGLGTVVRLRRAGRPAAQNVEA